MESVQHSGTAHVRSLAGHVSIAKSGFCDSIITGTTSSVERLPSLMAVGGRRLALGGRPPGAGRQAPSMRLDLLVLTGAMRRPIDVTKEESFGKPDYV